jgi:AAA domain
MSGSADAIQPSLSHLAAQIADLSKSIVLVFAFNGTGKTRLSMEYKDLTKSRNNGEHSGVYYNAYSEDLFYWDNDDENDGADTRLVVRRSSLNLYHANLDDAVLREKLAPYRPMYDFQFHFHPDASEGIESVQFFLKNGSDVDPNKAVPIKISRGEEQIFIWCFFLALFEVQSWTGKQSSHFFIDDPVSSLDDHNIFVTASSVMDLIENHFRHRKIIITTHHVGFFSILWDWLKKGEKSESYKKQIQTFVLKTDGGGCKLVPQDKEVFLFHLHLLRTLQLAADQNQLFAFHFALLRQVLENVSSFLGVGRISFVLEQIGFSDPDEIARIVNTLSHKTVFRYEAKEMVPDNERMFRDVFSRLQIKYQFVLHEADS